MITLLIANNNSNGDKGEMESHSLVVVTVAHGQMGQVVWFFPYIFIFLVFDWAIKFTSLFLFFSFFFFLFLFPFYKTNLHQDDTWRRSYSHCNDQKKSWHWKQAHTLPYGVRSGAWGAASKEICSQWHYFWCSSQTVQARPVPKHQRNQGHVYKAELRKYQPIHSSQLSTRYTRLWSKRAFVWILAKLITLLWLCLFIWKLKGRRDKIKGWLPSW